MSKTFSLDHIQPLIDYGHLHFGENKVQEASYLGVIKFNTIARMSNRIIPLGGIKVDNLNQLKIVFSEGLALLSEVKKKPAKIFSRLL